ncbi:MAG TPA: hypothetical protein VEK08_27005 [Planctomycetota bacterium]|nr:hypothetical protein [Planctomycetota bacterium]
MGNHLRRIRNILLFPFIFPAILFLGCIGFSVTRTQREEEEELEDEAAQAQIEEANEDDPRKRSYGKDQTLLDYNAEQCMQIARNIQSEQGAQVTPVVPLNVWWAEKQAARHAALERQKAG